jgi:putative transcriptional regulator
MDKERFERLVESIKQIKEIEKGEMKPARVHRHYVPTDSSLREASGMKQDEIIKVQK